VGTVLVLVLFGVSCAERAPTRCDYLAEQVAVAAGTTTPKPPPGKAQLGSLSVRTYQTARAQRQEEIDRASRAYQHECPYEPH